MKISVNWLREFVPLSLDGAGMAQRLTLAGIEVAAVHPALPPFRKVVVAKVLSLAPHPDADKLKVCQVDAGSGRRVQIVCGAPNVRTGMKAPLALPGGTLPDGSEIKQVRLRGVESAGMLCSARELGLAEETAGLWILPDDAPLGMDLREYLGGEDELLEIEITPNRGDCLSVLGVARELATLFAKPLEHDETPTVQAAIRDTLPVEMRAPQACPIYGGRVLKGIRADAITPMWMRERLRRAGLQCVHTVVDVTQYVMLELGQPMHAYDLAKLDRGIVVRNAQAGETVKLLNGSSYTLQPDVVVIADHSRLQGLGGIMGGADSKVAAGTRDIFLEAAHFTPAAVSGRPRQLDLLTDAAYRFERGVDPAGPARALERATQLILEIAGGQPGPVTLNRSEGNSTAQPIRLRRARLAALLGISVPDAEVKGILTRLGFDVQTVPEGWNSTAPSHRFDIEIEEDLIEEVGRVYGYDRIPAVQYPNRQPMPPLPEASVSSANLRNVLVQRGYQEVITYSFVEPSLQLALSGTAGLALANPIAADLAEMRRSLWPGLVEVLRYNLNRQQMRVRIFEIGLRFIQQDNDIKQESVIAGLVSGPVYPLQWGLDATVPVEFSDLKNDVEALLVPASAGPLTAEPAPHPALHPGQSACLRLAGQELGWMGALHPAHVRRLDLPQGAFLFELRLAPLLAGRLPQAQPVARFPAVRRDLALVVEENVPAATLLAAARAAGGVVLQEVNIFDIYRGKGIDSGRKSIALGLILQDSSRTLTDEAADAIVARVAEQLQHQLGATIRD